MCGVPGLATTRESLVRVAKGLAAAKPQLIDVRVQTQYEAQSWALVRSVCPPAAPSATSPQALMAWIYYVVAGASGDALFGKSWSGAPPRAARPAGSAGVHASGAGRPARAGRLEQAAIATAPAAALSLPHMYSCKLLRHLQTPPPPPPGPGCSPVLAMLPCAQAAALPTCRHAACRSQSPPTRRG